MKLRWSILGQDLHFVVVCVPDDNPRILQER